MKVALLVSGGMAKGAYQIGALKAVQKYFSYKDIKITSASSIGCLNSYAFLTGKLDNAETIWRSINVEKDNIFITKLYKSDFLENAIKFIASERIDTGKLITPLLHMNLSKKQLNYCNISKTRNTELREKYLRASISVPFISKGVKINENVYYDGAAVENIPIKPLLKEDLDLIIAIYFDRKSTVFNDENIYNKTIRVCFDDNSLIKNATIFSKDKIDYMINKGEEVMNKVLDCIIKDNHNTLSTIYAKIQEYNKNINNIKGVSLCSSHILSLINKVTKHLVIKENDIIF